MFATNLQIHSYLYSSSHPSHIKNFIPFSQYLRLRRLFSDDSDFSEKLKAMCQFFDKPGHPTVFFRSSGPPQGPTNWSTVGTTNGWERKYWSLSFTLTFHSDNHAVTWARVDMEFLFEYIVIILQEVWDQVNSWSLKNRLVVHEGKFEAMILSTKPFIGPMKPLKWGDDIIWHVSSSECLGVTIDDKLSWSQHWSN